MKPLNHNLFNRRNLVWLIVAAVAIFLLYLVFRDGDQSPSHKEEKKEVAQEQKLLQQADQTTSTEVTQWQHRFDSLHRENKVLRTEKEQVKKELSASRQTIRQVIALMDSAKAKADTSKYMAAAEQLRNKAEAQDGMIEHYEQVIDSAFVNYEQQITAKDSIINAQADLLAKFRLANISLVAKYNTLNTDYTKAVRKVKREKTLNRVLAAGALVLGGLIITK